MADPKDDLLKIVNAHGYLLQLRVAHAITATATPDYKEVLASEHKWAIAGDEGFIDLIVSIGTNGKLVIECKRTTDAQWIFLVPAGESETRQTRLLWTMLTSDDRIISGWDEFKLYTPSLASSFCMVRGQGEHDMTMLERIASKLLRATEGLAQEENAFHRGAGFGGLHFYFPTIVTNADLKVCRYDANNVDIMTGKIDDADFEDVPFLRFTKSMSSEVGTSKDPTNLKSSAAESQRTVLVVNSNHLSQMLKSRWSLDKPDEFFDEKWPWDLTKWKSGEQQG